MKPGLAVGQTYAFSIQVQESMTARFEDVEVHPLYGTAAMITHMEWAARQHILPYLEPGEEGVGYHIDVKHLKPTAIGETVHIRSTVTAFDGNRVESRVEAWNITDQIGDGILVQAIVSKQKLYAIVSKEEIVPEANADGEATMHDTQEPARLFSSAQLSSSDGSQLLFLQVIGWETNLLPCTYYDEWLSLRIKIRTTGQPAGHYQTIDASLLRIELEQWCQAMHAIAEEAQMRFQSDFLDEAVRVCVEPGIDGNHAVDILIHPPASTEADLKPVAEAVHWHAAVTSDALLTFSCQLAQQLEAFPSRL